ncbi:MAG: hypothetical protein KZQ82_10730 [Candidatus Thiodiazotropha sp. (ex Lucinoma annulata)]|nr:hypothetical protein [Candidatus Thiodiazotropha sp. (ex Lucinoma annulata)]
MEENRIKFAKYQIYNYVNELFICLCELISEHLEENMNKPSHGLSEKELVILLYELFSEYKLVAQNGKRGFFTPTLEEIENALKEKKDLMYISKKYILWNYNRSFRRISHS